MRGATAREKAASGAVQAVNEAVRALHDKGQVSVVSFCEGLPLNLLGRMMPKVAVVPMETCYPGAHTYIYVHLPGTLTCTPSVISVNVVHQHPHRAAPACRHALHPALQSIASVRSRLARSCSTGFVGGCGALAVLGGPGKHT